MALFPFERYELISALTRSVIEEEIRTTDFNTEEYAVTLTENIVTIHTNTGFRVGGYSQSFRPRAVIKLKSIEQGAMLTVVLKPNPNAIAVLVLVVSILLSGIYYSQRNNIAVGNYKDASVAAISLLALAYLLPVTAFNSESSKLKSFIADFFEVVNPN